MVLGSFLRAHLSLIAEEIKVVILFRRVAVHALGRGGEVEEAVSLRIGGVERADAVARFTLDTLKILSRCFGPISGEPLIACDMAGKTIRIGLGVLD